MLRVTVEIVPYGLEEHAKDIGLLQISNIGCQENNHADYKIEHLDPEGITIDIFEIEKFNRDKGFWLLVKNATEQVYLRSKKDG